MLIWSTWSTYVWYVTSLPLRKHNYKHLTSKVSVINNVKSLKSLTPSKWTKYSHWWCPYPPSHTQHLSQQFSQQHTQDVTVKHHAFSWCHPRSKGHNQKVNNLDVKCLAKDTNMITVPRIWKKDTANNKVTDKQTNSNTPSIIWRWGMKRLFFYT